MDKQLNLVFQGIKTSDDMISISTQRDLIHDKYSADYKDEWKPGDRTQRQYWALYGHKNLKVVEFFCRWEYENKNRIPIDVASSLIENPEKFLEESNDNVIRNDKLEQKRKKSEEREDFTIVDD